MSNPIRVVLFENRSTALLIHAPEGVTVALPELCSPFTKEKVTLAAKVAGVDLRVSVEPTAGRWGGAVERRKSDQKAERMQRVRMDTETTALQLRHANDPMLRDRARLLARKQEVDDQLRAAKLRMTEVKRDVRMSQRYAPPEVYRRLEETIADLQSQSIGLQGQLGVIKRNMEEVRSNTFHDKNKRFVDLAKQILDQDEFEELMELAHHPELPDEDE